MMVHHHVKYNEIHGIDEVVMMTRSDHAKLHRRLRRENKCNIPSKELGKITRAAYQRSELGKLAHATHIKSDKGKLTYAANAEHRKKTMIKYNGKNIKQITFYCAADVGIFVAERISFNSKTGNIIVSTWLNHPRREIIYIDI